jgi:hypothetical protein
VEFDGDRRRFTKMAVGSSGEIEDKIQYDGKEVARFRKGNGIDLYDLGKESPYLICDPRILGINAAYRGIDTIDEFPDASTNEWKFEAAGQEIIDGRNTWHVRTRGPGVAYNWWIDDKNNFRVYRYVVDMGEYGHYDVNSTYDQVYSWLPSKIEEEDFDRNAHVTCRRTFVLSKAEENVKFGEDAWTLAGMDLPTNDVQVTDTRKEEIIGYWDGVKIRPYAEPGPHQPFQPVSPPPSRVRTVFVALLVAMFLAPLAFVVSKYGKRK